MNRKPHAFPAKFPPVMVQNAFQYTAFWSNVVTHVVISMRKHDTNGTKGVVGGQIADMVLAYLKDVQFLEKAFYYVPAPDKINRKAALGVCKRLFAENVIEVMVSGRRSLIPGEGFSELKRYRLPQVQNNIASGLVELMDQCSLAPNSTPTKSRGSLNGKREDTKENRPCDISYEVFTQLFGTPGCDSSDTEDDASESSLDLMDERSSSSERNFLHFWETNFRGCMDIWREVSLRRFLELTDIIWVEKFSHSVEDDGVAAASVNSGSFVRNIKLPPLISAAIALLDDSPGAVTAILQANVTDIHPLTLIKPILAQCGTRFPSTVPDNGQRFSMNTRSQKSEPGAVLPGHHTDLHLAMYQLLVRRSKDALVAFQLYTVLLPWTRREYFRKLLNFLQKASLPGVPLFNTQMSNKDFLLQKFQAVVFCDPTLPEKARIMLMTCMIDNPELIFDIPEGLKEEVEARICEIGKLGPAAPRQTFCENATVDYANSAITNTALVSLFNTIGKARSNGMGRRERQKLLMAFKEFHPQVYLQYAGSLDTL